MYVAERKIDLESHYRVDKKKKRKIYLVKTVKMKTRIIHWRIPGKLWLTRTEGRNLLLVYYSNTVIACKNVTVLKHIVQFLLENSYDSLEMLMVAFLIDLIAVILNMQTIFLIFIDNFNTCSWYVHQHLAGVLWP